MQNTELIKRSPKLLIPSSIAGGVFAGVLISGVTLLFKLVNVLNPELLNSILVIAVGTPITIGIFAVSLALAIIAGFFTLPKTLGTSRFSIIIFGSILAVEIIIGIIFALPDTSEGFVLVLGILGGMTSYLAISVSLIIPKIFRILIIVLLLTLAAYVSEAQYSSGTYRAQINGLMNTGYTIYVPPKDDPVSAVDYIAPINHKYSGYKDGVLINLKNKNDASKKDQLVERKVASYLPLPNCGEAYVDTNSKSMLDSYTCKLIERRDKIHIYLRELKFYASYYQTYEVTQEYFAIIEGTVIYTEGSYQYSMDKNMTIIKPDLTGKNDIEGDKASLLKLIPLQQERAKDYIIKR